MKLLSAARIGTLVLCLVISDFGTASADAAPSPTPPSDCRGSFNPYDYTPSALAACGIPTYPATVAPLRGGGEMYSYYEPSGSLFAETTLPPAGFDPTTASAAQLSEYEYPPRPSDPTAEIRWERMVKIPRSTPESFIPDLTGFSFSANLNNTHWSGQITTSGGFTYAEADYTEPTFDNTVCGKSAEVTWAGIGGGPNATGGSALFQDGTAHSNNVNIGIADHEPWYEIAIKGNKTSAQVFTHSGPFPNQGDAVTAVTDTQSRPGYVIFGVYDYSINKTWQITKARNGATPNPATAEMIAERPLLADNTYPFLSKWVGGTIGFTSDEAAQNGIEQSLSNFSTDRIFMTTNGQSSGGALASPTNLGSYGSFGDAWQGCGADPANIAFQGTNGDLFTLDASGTLADNNLGMEAGTSPSITAYPTAGWIAAFEANTVGFTRSTRTARLLLGCLWR